MVKKTKRLVLGILFISMFLTCINFGASVAYPETIKGEYFSMLWKRDYQTDLPQQICTFTIKEIITGQQNLSKTDNFSQYETENSTTWHTEQVLTPQVHSSYSSKINTDNRSVLFPNVGVQTYSPFKDTPNSLILEHRALTGYLDQQPSAYFVFDSASVGEISFDALIFMNATLPYNESEPLGSFYVGLGYEEDLNDTFNVYFETKALTIQNNFTLAAYVDGINPESQQKNVKTQIFQGQDGIFNWINVKVFFDVYNDVYNITIKQYRIEGTGNLVDPVSSVFRGNRYDSSNWRLSYHGTRFISTQLVNTARFWIKTDAVGARSVAYVDNFEANVYRFPAVYADVKLENSTISKKNPGGISYINKSAISSYQPPKYPDASRNLALDSDYTKNVQNPTVLTNWPIAPSWLYSFPLVVSENNHDLNVRSILHYVNHPEIPIEKMGVLEPQLTSAFYTRAYGGPLASQYFEYLSNESKLEQFDYHFKARYTNYYLRVKYFEDPIRKGLIEAISISPDSVRNDQKAIVLVDFRFAGGEQSDIPGYPLITITTAISTIALFIYTKRKKLKIEN